MVDFVFIVRYIVAAVVTFMAIFIMSPLLYNVWFNYLRPLNPTTALGLQMIDVGDTFFDNFRILAFVVPGLIIIWGFVIANRKRVQETSF